MQPLHLVLDVRRHAWLLLGCVLIAAFESLWGGLTPVSWPALTPVAAVRLHFSWQFTEGLELTAEPITDQALH